MRTPNKITAKVTGASKSVILELVMKNKGKVMPLFSVVGAAFKATVEDADNGLGEYIKLHGQFKAISALTGEEMVSGVVCLPDVASTVIAGQLACKQEEGEAKVVEVALTISARYEENAATNYVYECDIHNSDEDAFAKLEALVPTKFLPKSKKK